MDLGFRKARRGHEVPLKQKEPFAGKGNAIGADDNTGVRPAVLLCLHCCDLGRHAAQDRGSCPSRI